MLGWDSGLWWEWEPTDSGTYTTIVSNDKAFAALEENWTISSWGNPSYWWEWEPTDSWYTQIFSNQQAFVAIKEDGSLTAWWNGSNWWSREPTMWLHSSILNKSCFCRL